MAHFTFLSGRLLWEAHSALAHVWVRFPLSLLRTVLPALPANLSLRFCVHLSWLPLSSRIPPFSGPFCREQVPAIHFEGLENKGPKAKQIKVFM